MTKRTIFILLWLAVAASVFAWTSTSYHAQVIPQLKDEIILRHALVMMFLTLPSGWALTALVSAILGVVNFQPVGVTEAYIVSLSCTIAGYMQWFVLLPWLWRKWKDRK
jgi:hypothetical protein